MPLRLHDHLIDKLAMIAGIFSGLALYPQVWSVLHGIHDGVSIHTYAIIFCNSIVWLLYAIHRRLFSLGISSVLNMIAAGVVFVWLTLVV